MSGTRTGTLLEQIRRLSVGPDAADAELLSRFVRGRDEDAFAELLRRHGPMVFGVGRRVLANDKDAEDVLRRLVRRGLTLSAAALATALEANTAAAVLPRKVTAAPVAVVVGQLAEKRSGASPALVAALVEQGLPSTAAHRSLLVLVGLLALGRATAASALRAPGGNQQPPPTKRPPPAEKVQPRTDRLGDPLPTGAVARLGTVRLRHDKPGVSNLTLLAFTPDSKVLLSADRSGALRFWEVATGKELRRLHVGDKESRWSDKEYRCFAVTSGCKLVAAANDDGIALWDVAATKKLGHLSVKGVQVVAFTPDGKMLAVSSPDKIVSLWDVGERKERLRLRGAKEVHTLRFTPDGKILVGSGRSGEISVWDVATGQLLRTLRGLDGPPGESQCLALSPDGKLLAAGGAERKPPATFNGRLVLWDLATGRELRRFQGHTYSVYSVAFTPDGKTLASAAYRSIRFWDVATGKELRRFQGSYWVSRFITFAPNGRVLASFTFEPTIRLWEVATGKPLHDYPGHQGDVMTVDFSPDGRLVVTGSHEWNNTHVRVWDAHTGEQRHLLRGHTAYVRRALFALNGKTIYSGSGDGTIRQWDVQTGKELRLLSISAKRKDLQDQVKTIVLSEDGKRLTSVSAGSGDPLQSKPTVVIWDLITGKQLTKRRSDPWDWAFLAARAGTFAWPRGRRTVILEEIATGKQRLSLQASPSQDNRTLSSPVCFSPDGSMLAALSHGSVRRGKRNESCNLTLHLWELATGKEVLVVLVSAKVGSWPVYCFAPDGRTLAIACGDTLWVCDVVTGKKLVVRRMPSVVTALAFSPDGGRLVTGHQDSTALVWDVSDAKARWGLRPGKLDRKRLSQLWTELAGENAKRAHTTLWTLVAVPGEAVALLRQRLRPAPLADPQRLRQLVADLDDRRFSVRDSATRELTTLVDQAQPVLQAALQQPLSLEYRRRIEALLALPPTIRTAESLRRNRAIRILEQIGTKEACLLLHRLAKGASRAHETQEAQAALSRLARRR